tara:strand:- start:7549 stop:8796 length:1248 start_codon:yes stop_codon:yes gene_type:complete
MMNISTQIETHIEPALLSLCKQLGQVASERNETLYLIGGVVRDALLGVESEDIDIVLDGDIESFCRDPKVKSLAAVISKSQFKTVKLQIGDTTMDIANARTEFYETPGSLPTISRATLLEDINRRDFTINSLAMSLSPDNFGLLIDKLGGAKDLENKILRGLYETTFQDDSTRIIRAAIYKARFEFSIDQITLSWIQRDANFIKSISDSRLNQEITRVLAEPYPERILEQLANWGITELLPTPFPYTENIERLFRALRNDPIAKDNLQNYYRLGLVVHSNKGTESNVRTKQLNEIENNTVLDTLELLSDFREHKAVESLGVMKPSQLSNYFDDRNTDSLVLLRCFIGDSQASRLIGTYLDIYSKVTPTLNGSEVINLGIPSGPKVGEILSALRARKIDGIITSRSDEENYVRSQI